MSSLPRLCGIGGILLLALTAAVALPTRVATETAIPLPAGLQPHQLEISADGRHVAGVATVNGVQQIMVDGKWRPAPPAGIRAPWMAQGASCDGDILPGVFFSPDGKRLAYAVKAGNGWAMVVDGVQQTAYDEIDIPVFSPDSRHVAYTAKVGNQWTVVTDGKAGKPYLYIGTGFGMDADPRTIRPIFTPDSSHLVFVARAKPAPNLEVYTSRLVVDDKEEDTYRELRDLTFSADGRHIAYAALSREMVSIEEADGQHTTVFAQSWRVVRDGTEGMRYAEVGEPVLGPDGARLIYPAKRGIKGWSLVDGKTAGPLYKNITTAVLSPDGKRVAYVAEQNKKALLIVDGQELARYDEINALLFSPDSAHLACLVRDDKGWHAWQDGAVMGYLPPVGPLLYSPDSSKLAFLGRKGETTHLIVNGKQLGSIKSLSVGTPVFTPDSKHTLCQVAITANGKPEKYIAVDGGGGRHYDDILPLGMREPYVYPDAPNRFHYLGVRDGKVYLAEERIEE